MSGRRCVRPVLIGWFRARAFGLHEQPIKFASCNNRPSDRATDQRTEDTLHQLEQRTLQQRSNDDDIARLFPMGLERIGFLTLVVVLAAKFLDAIFMSLGLSLVDIWRRLM